MQIRFNSLKEIKEFILMVDIYHLCDKQEPWGGRGYIVTDRYPDLESKKEIIVTIPEKSKVIHRSSDQIIVTPYVKQLSWLFMVLQEHVEYGVLPADVLLNCFHSSCEGYFIMNPGHSAKELMIFVLDAFQRVIDADKEEGEEK